MIFILIAAILNAFMDRIAWDFSTSIVRKLNPKFWNPNVSYEYAKTTVFIKYRWDAWHIAKTLMISCLILAVFLPNRQSFSLTHRLWTIVEAGIIWDITFNIFFDYIFKRKNED